MGSEKFNLEVREKEIIANTAITNNNKFYFQAIYFYFGIH